MSALAWARLLRLSLAPSAAADVAAGALVGGFGRFPAGPEPWLAIGASLAVYHGGMALNDYADRAHDARTRPERPLPSQAISARAALALGVALELAAVALAATISLRAAAWMLGLVALVLAYDFGNRGAWSGPILLGACRAANLGFGLLLPGVLSAARFGGDPASSAVLVLGEPPANAWVLMLLYGAYVTCSSRVARLEDLEDRRELGRAPSLYLGLAALLLVAPAFVDPFERRWSGPDLLALALAALGAASLAWTALRTSSWTPALAGRATGMALRRLLVFTATVALLARREGGDALLVAAAILAGFPLSAALRRVVPPT